MIEAGIFDVGGVLIEWDPRYIAEDVKKTLHLPDEVFLPAWSDLLPGLDTGHLSEEDFWQKFTSATHTEQFLPETSLFLREFRNNYKPNEDVLDIVNKLDASGLRLAILSNTIASHVAFLEEQGLYQSFPVTVFSHEVGLAKPDPAIYTLTLEKLKLEPQQTFFVDDRRENVDAASALGMHGIIFQGAEKLRRDLGELGVTV